MDLIARAKKERFLSKLWRDEISEYIKTKKRLPQHIYHYLPSA